jgi:BolA protein
MNLEEMIRARLSRLAPETLEVFDDSHEHAGHAGAKEGGGHFQLVIVAREFAGKSAAARHRLVYDALSDMMPKQIHALAIRAYAPEELGTSAKG